MVKEIYQKTKEIIFVNPRKLLDEEIALVNKPFFFKGGKEAAVLMIHGWTSTAYELRRLGLFLNLHGYTVSIPMLKGHGTVPKDLEDVKWEDWFNQIDQEYCKLRKEYTKVYVVGTSIGSNLAMLLAQKHSNIPALILMATPFKLKFEKLTVLFAQLMGKLKKYNNKYYPPTFGSRHTITRLIAYQSYPIKSALEVFNLIQTSREVVSLVQSPVFVLQSLSDHIATKHSLRDLYNSLGSKVKKKKYIKRAYHTFISDIRNENVFQEILEFIQKN